MNILFKLILSLLFVVWLFAGFRVYVEECHRRGAKQDLIELSKIKYGLFNVDEWKVLMADIIAKKIDELDLSEQNREAMRGKIESFLTKAIGDFEIRYFEENSKSISGIFKSGVASLIGTFSHLKKDIPKFTEEILNFVEKEENRNAIRGYLIEQLNQYADKTFSRTDYSQQKIILDKYGQTDVASTKSELRSKLQTTRVNSQPYKILVVGMALLLISILVFVHRINRTELLLIVLMSSLFLVLGVFLPMIEIDARILEMSFSLLGEEVLFTDQVLYHKSKSIIEVVELMLSQGRLDLIGVGLLVLAFSVLFPLAKMVSSALYLSSPQYGTRKFIHFMVFKSGKWSMADVMVIAIFMAYIGFDGIISEQLNQVQSVAKSLDLMTTNNSNLLFGFYSFTLFVVLSLFISQKIQSSIPQVRNPQ